MGRRHLGCGRPLARHENVTGKVLSFELPARRSTSVAKQSMSAKRAQKNGFSVLTPDLWKSTTFRVTTVRPCSRPVAAIRPSIAGRGWLSDRASGSRPIVRKRRQAHKFSEGSAALCKRSTINDQKSIGRPRDFVASRFDSQGTWEP